MEIAQIGEMIGLASSAAGTMSQAADSIQNIKKLFQSGSESDRDEAAKLLNTLAAELTAANMMNVQISTALKELSSHIREHDEFQKEKARYELFQTGQNDVVYRLRDEAAEGQPSHFICPVCMNKDKFISYISGEGDFKVCQTNREHCFRFKDTPIRTVSIY